MNQENKKDSDISFTEMECRIKEMSGLFFRLFEELEVLRFGVFGMIGANLALILLLAFM